MSNQEAIDIIIEDIKIHRQWLDWNIENEEHIDECDVCWQTQKVAGDAEWHREWLHKYDVVYTALKENNDNSK